MDLLKWRDYEVKVERKRFYRRIAVFVEANESVRVKVASLTPKRSIVQFLDQHADWIDKQLQQFIESKNQYPKLNYIEGEKLPLLGYQVELVWVERSKYALEKSKLILPKQEFNDPAKAVRKVYKDLAVSVFQERIDFWQNKMALQMNSIKIRSYKSRWGSCSNHGDISLNWKLVAAPLAVIDYVIIHELSHIVHMNHSKDFWQLVESHCTDYLVLRKWLKKHHFYFDFLAEKSELYS